MLDLNDLRVWLKVVDVHSFTKAGDILGMPVSSVSARVTRLESELGVQLLERTTRKLRLTEAGETLHDVVKHALESIDTATGSAGAAGGGVSGRLRLTTSSPIAQGRLGQLLLGFLKLYPLINVDVFVTARKVDLIEEDFDLAIRAGVVADTALVARRLGSLRARLYAGASSQAAQQGLQHPSQLSEFPLLAMMQTPHHTTWNLTDDKRATHTLRFVPRLSSSDDRLVAIAAAGGIGIASLPELTAQPFVERGELIPILPTWCVREVEVHAVFPSHKGCSVATKLFLDYLEAHW